MSRLRSTLLNARVGAVFYMLTLLAAFFSRRIFLDQLGVEFMGLAGTLLNLLAYLNLAEFGVGAAVGFRLYKPLQLNDRAAVSALVSQFGFYYGCAGAVVAAGAVVLSLFFPLMFGGSEVSLPLVYCAFYAFVASAVTDYLCGYRQIVLSADQQCRQVTVVTQTIMLAKVGMQMAVALRWANPYAWIGIELAFGLATPLALRRVVTLRYGWLRCSMAEGLRQHRLNPGLMRTTRRVFVHKLKDFLLTQSDQLLVFAFVSLRMVAFYGNYLLLATKLTGLFGMIGTATVASVGNLVAQGRRSRILEVFWQLMSLRWVCGGVAAWGMATLASPLICVWLGPEYRLPGTVVALLAACVLITVTRATVDEFNHAYGHYDDVWAAWLECGLNVAVTLVAAWQWGIAGILAGKLVSLIPMVVIWKPVYLFGSGFGMPMRPYWAFVAKGLAALALAWLVTGRAMDALWPAESLTLGELALMAAGSLTMFATVYVGTLLMLWPALRGLFKRLIPAFSREADHNYD